MQNGYVFKIAPNFFGIFLFSDSTPLMARYSDEQTVEGACAEFARIFAGNFKPLPRYVIPLVKDMMDRRDTVVLSEFN